MLKGERILTASHDGSVKMWDIRSGYSCVATVGKNSSPVLCVDYDDNTSMLAAAGVDGYVSLPHVYFIIQVSLCFSGSHQK